MRKRTGRERFGGAAIGTDLNYEGITTKLLHGVVDERYRIGTDLNYEGITTNL